MPLVNTTGQTPRETANWTALNLFAEQTGYQLFLSPQEMFPNGAGATRGDNGKFERLEFADGSSANFAVGNRAVPKNWVSGKVRVSILYGGSAASTNPIRWNLIFNSHPLGTDIATPSEVNQSLDLAGPATATFLLEGVFTTLGTMTGGDRLMGVVITPERAHANDTYAGVAYLYGVLLDFFPNR